MEAYKDTIDLFIKARKFEFNSNRDNQLNSVIKEFTIIYEKYEMGSFPILLYCLDDNSEDIDITQGFIEPISAYYYDFKRYFFTVFLQNLNIIYPHAIQMTRNILAPIVLPPYAATTIDWRYS